MKFPMILYIISNRLVYAPHSPIDGAPTLGQSGPESKTMKEWLHTDFTEVSQSGSILVNPVGRAQNTLKSSVIR